MVFMYKSLENCRLEDLCHIQSHKWTSFAQAVIAMLLVLLYM